MGSDPTGSEQVAKPGSRPGSRAKNSSKLRIVNDQQPKFAVNGLRRNSNSV